MVTCWSNEGYMIPISSHLSLLTKLLRASCYCHPHFSCTDLDITYSCTDLDTTSYISAQAFSGVEVLRVLQSRAD